MFPTTKMKGFHSSMQIFFTVPGAPVPKARPRGRIAKNRYGYQIVSMYTPKTTATFENKVGYYFSMKYTFDPIDEPVRVCVAAYFPIPQSWPKKKKEHAQYHTVPVVTKPDCDNIIKSILDGLNGIAFVDDKQVFALSISKYYSINPRTEISISTEA